MLILCIDDDSDVLDWMRINLESKGYKVETAGGEAEGIARYTELKPDLVFVDMMMEEPDSGINVYKAIRKTDSTTPVYLLSSVGESLCSLTDCATFEFQDVIQKPIKLDTLLSIVGKALRK